MRREGQNYDEALRFIADSVASFRQQLAMGREVSMGRLGYFRCNEGRFIEFVPFVHDNACDKYYGLANLKISSVDALEHELTIHEIDEHAPVTTIPEHRNLFTRKAAQIAASVALLIGLGILLSTPIIVDRNHDTASMAPEVSVPQPQQLGVTVQQGVVPQTIEVVESNPALAAVGNTTGKYYLVIATLRNQHELDAFKNKYSALVPYMKSD